MSYRDPSLLEDIMREEVQEQERAKAKELTPELVQSSETPEPEKRGKSVSNEAPQPRKRGKSVPKEEEVKSEKSKTIEQDVPSRKVKGLPEKEEEVSVPRGKSMPKEGVPQRLEPQEATSEKIPVSFK